ncbi:MAG: response regulator [Desulfobulbaceae bacterium]|nr:response regulator [Desulfobulbaceae bacterium]
MSIYKDRKPINIAEARILAVDDEETLCRMVAILLNREGFHCDTAVNVDDALEMLEQRSYDLIVSDIMMPGKSGIDFLDIVSVRFPDTAMIMATAVDNRDTAITTLEKGAFGYVIKPFERNEIVISVINALERRRIVLEHDRYEKHLEQEVRDRTADIRAREEEIALRLISASGHRDEETGQHIKRIGLIGAVLAEKIGWKQERIDFMRIAGAMHDVGKIGIPDEILHKTGKLTPEEFEIIKTHTLIGGRILENSSIPLLEMARDIAIHHHEKWDGSGYPYGLRENEIPEAAQIIALTDVYDALSNDRVYRKAMPEQEVLAIMAAGKGSHFNPRLYDCFVNLLPEIHRILATHRDEEN